MVTAGLLPRAWRPRSRAGSPGDGAPPAVRVLFQRVWGGAAFLADAALRHADDSSPERPAETDLCCYAWVDFGLGVLTNPVSSLARDGPCAAPGLERPFGSTSIQG